MNTQIDRIEKIQYLNKKGYDWTFLETLSLERLNFLYLKYKYDER